MKTLWEKEKLLVMNKIIVSSFVYIFDIISLFAAEFEKANPFYIKQIEK